MKRYLLKSEYCGHVRVWNVLPRYIRASKSYINTVLCGLSADLPRQFAQAFVWKDHMNFNNSYYYSCNKRVGVLR